MWTPEHRRAAERRGLRYPSDLTDAEWVLVEPAIPLLVNPDFLDGLLDVIPPRKRGSRVSDGAPALDPAFAGESIRNWPGSNATMGLCCRKSPGSRREGGS